MILQNPRKLAVERIKSLFKHAEAAFSKYPERSNRYITMARKIAMKTKTKIPSNLKRRYCKHCYKYLKPGVNCRVRINKSRVIYYCLNCKKFTRIPVKK